MFTPFRCWPAVLLLAGLLASPCSLVGADLNPLLLIDDWLTGKEPLDTIRKTSRAKVHTVSLNAGALYLVEARSDDFNTYLRVETAGGKVLAQGQGLPADRSISRVVVTPAKDEQCRVIVTSADAGRTGAYALHADKLRMVGASEEIKGKLTDRPPGGVRPVAQHDKNWKAGEVYLLKASSTDFAPLLAVVDPWSIPLVADFNQSGGAEVQVLVRTRRDGFHPLEVASDGKLGNYSLLVQKCELTSKEDLTDREKSIRRADRLTEQAMEAAGKDGEQARKLAEQSAVLREELFPKSRYPQGHLRVVVGLNQLGLALINQGKFAGALPHLERARAMYEQLDPHRRHPYINPASLHNLANALNAVGRPKEALPYARELYALRETVAGQHIAYESQLLKLALTVDLRRHLFLSITAQLAPDPSTYRLLFSGKAVHTRVLQRRHAEARAARSQSASLEQELQMLIDLNGELASLRRAPRPWAQVRIDRVEKLINEKEGLQLAVQHKLAPLPRYQRLDTLGPDDLAKHLQRANAVYVDFMRYMHMEKDHPTEARYTAFVVSQPGQVVRVDLGAAKPIEDAIALWRQAVTGWKRDLKADQAGQLEATARAEALKLFKGAWAPVAKHFPPGTKTAYLALEGQLTRLPFGALPAGPNKDTILLEELTIAHAPYGPFLLEQFEYPPPEPKDAGRALLVGGVKYGDTDQPWSFLRGSVLEIDEILNVAGKRLAVESLRAEKATTNKVKELLPQVRYAHFATHGFFDALGSARDTERVQAIYDDRRAGAPSLLGGPGKWNPLVYTGLACAGVNAPAAAGLDEGVLPGEVIADLRLDQLNLAVLSACDTGLGESSGPEGVQGLQLAFHFSGCPNVVASLWKVNDAATGLLMARCYHELWANGRPPAEALRHAQLFIYRRPDLVEEWSKKLPKWDEIRAAPRVHEARLDEVLKHDIEPVRKDRTPAYLWAAFVLSGSGR